MITEKRCDGISPKQLEWGLRNWPNWNPQAKERVNFVVKESESPHRSIVHQSCDMPFPLTNRSGITCYYAVNEGERFEMIAST